MHKIVMQKLILHYLQIFKCFEDVINVIINVEFADNNDKLKWANTYNYIFMLNGEPLIAYVPIVRIRFYHLFINLWWCNIFEI